MAVDLEAIARRGRCDVSSLRIALPLLEQGYSPPFLARYRRDELSGIDEASLWALAAAVNAEQAIQSQKDALVEKWESTPLSDPALGHAIRKSNSQRVIDRLTRRVKQESGESADPSRLLAVRVLNPKKGDGVDLKAIAEGIEGATDADAAVAGLDEAIVNRLAGDPRVIANAVRWLSKNARIHIAKISDPHTAANEAAQAAAEKAEAEKVAAEKAAGEAQKTPETPAVAAEVAETAVAPETTTPPESSGAESAPAETNSAAAAPAAATEVSPEVAADAPTASDAVAAESVPEPASTPEAATPAESAAPAETAPAVEAKTPEAKPAGKAKAEKKEKPAAKKSKKISPRQRRRRWLVSVLKPLAGKRFGAAKLSSFQIVMLGRALRSQVAECSFEYDAAKMVEEIKRTVGGFNRPLEAKLSALILEHEAGIREAAEAAWWDELHERASTRLVGIAADHLRKQVNRGGVDAKIVMSIDAVGPRTAATTIVSSDGRVLHCEDLPCALSAAQRTQAVGKMGELIHAHHVDLIVISNGPARRACMIALGELISQSPESSVRWTLADRSGADAYAGSDIAGQEMRSTSRRFRAAAWLAFSVLQPAHALAKVDPLKLRLSSFQRELSDDAMRDTLENVMTSGASRGGVDANAASAASLARLPGMSASIADAIDAQRRKALIQSRDELLELAAWGTVAESRQALPFLRVFGSEEALDGTLIHPDDYALAKKLAGVLEIELPPSTPPGYTAPVFTEEAKESKDRPGLKETTLAPESPVVEDLSESMKTDESFAADVVTSESVESNPAELSEAAEASQESATEAAASEEKPAEEAPTEEAPASESPSESETPAAEALAAEALAAETPAADGVGDDANAETAESKPAENAAVADRVRRPRPEKAKIDKCIKEWQVGSNRVNQLVSWLCDPFGDSDISGNAPAVLDRMPTQSTLKEGDEVIGVVVGVMPFGVFVELAPDCSGLIHVSKVTDSFVEDLHEVIQVGDVITTWVTSIDTKKKRVALSAISPEREQQLREERSSSRGAGGRGSNQRGGANRGGNQRGASGGQNRGGGQGRGGESRGGQSRGGGQGRGGKPSGRGGGGRGRDNRGRDSRGGGRRDRKPESYNVVGKKIDNPITDAMQKGDEPLRSFGDLLQFMGKGDKPEPKADKKKEKKVATPVETAPASGPPADKPPASEAAGGEKPPADSQDASASTDASES